MRELVPLLEFDLSQINEIPRGTIHEFFEGDTPEKPLVVEHAKRGRGVLLATNPDDGLAYVKWDIPAKGVDVAGTWERSWVGMHMLSVVQGPLTFFHELDLTGMPPGWISTAVPALLRQLDRVRPDIERLIAREADVDSPEHLAQMICSLVLNGVPDGD